MNLVIDASVALAWSLPDEGNDYSESVINALINGTAYVPSHWAVEVANGICNAERRTRLNCAQACAVCRQIDKLPLMIVDSDLTHVLDVVLPLARDTGLTVYDAAYLELAMRMDYPLATLDDELERAAKKRHVRLFGVSE